MSRSRNRRLTRSARHSSLKRTRCLAHHRRRRARPVAAYRRRGVTEPAHEEAFNAPELWHEPTGRECVKVVVQNPGDGCVHPVTADEVLKRIQELPARWTQKLEVVQFSRMTRKRALFPCYGMQWGTTIYLYPIEESLVETYVRPPKPQQVIEARMYGGRWRQDGKLWVLEWTPESIRDFYLNNVLIHEIGHINDDRNTSFDDRERFANWFAIEYGYRACRST